MVLYRLRAELRTRWRAWLGLALLVGLAAGTMTAVAAGARRTDNAYSRFLDAQRAADIIVINYPDDGTALFDFDEIAHLPQVADSARGGFEYVIEEPGFAGVDGRLGRDLHRARVLDGRWPDPSRPEEVAAGFEVAQRYDLEIGDEIKVFEELEGLDLSQLSPADRASVERMREALPGGALQVVGIVAAPDEFPPHALGNPCCFHHSVAYTHLGLQDGEVLAVRLEHGAADVPAFRSELEARSGGRRVQALNTHDHARAVQRSLHVQAVALWILAGLGALVAALMLAQLLARLAWLEAGDHATLDALGTTRGERFRLGLARALVIALTAAVACPVVAVALSPLFPTGLARTAEPDPGLAVDAQALAIGAIGTIVVVAGAAAVPAWRAARTRRAGGGPRRSFRWPAASVRAPVPAQAGVRMALQRGHGPAAVPVWSSLGAVALGAGALAGALLFGSSLDHLLTTPRLYGLGWDLAVTGYDAEVDVVATLTPVVDDHPQVEGIAFGWIGESVRLGGEDVGAIAMDRIKGDALPPATSGRLPTGANEVALGGETMRRLGVAIGDVVEVALPDGGSGTLRVVGQVVLPAIDVSLQLGEGALITYSTAVALEAEAEQSDDPGGLFLDLQDGADAGGIFAELREDLCRDRPPEAFCDLFRVNAGAPNDLVNFGRVRTTPIILGGVVAVLAVGALAHVVVTTIHRRRRDLALLKALGFTGGQVHSAVRWLASTIAVLAAVIGVPLGLIVGRWLWQQRAADLGFIFEPRLPTLAVALVVPAAAAVGGAIAWLPGRVAARAAPAETLRGE